MNRFLQSIGALALDFVLPPTCGVCGTAGSFLCARCRAALPVAAPPRCRRCWRIGDRPVCAACRDSPLAGARSAYVFDGGARALVHALKYDSMRALAAPMGELLADAFEADPFPVDLVLPVPLHGRRQRRRGFNQSELLGRAVARRASLELDITSLRRVRNTAPQVQVRDPRRRAQNVQGAFRCDERVNGRRVLLVDDVLTTGVTLRECARTLRRSGAASVWALTFCHDD
jgi:ComF family protein